MTEDITYKTMISNANKDNDDNSKFITNDFSASDEDYKNKEVFLDDDPETVYKISYRTFKKNRKDMLKEIFDCFKNNYKTGLNGITFLKEADSNLNKTIDGDFVKIGSPMKFIIKEIHLIH